MTTEHGIRHSGAKDLFEKRRDEKQTRTPLQLGTTQRLDLPHEYGAIHEPNVFELAGISMWQLDVTDVCQVFDELKSQGVQDFQEHFEDHYDQVAELVTRLHPLRVNRATLELYESESESELQRSLERVFKPTMPAFRKVLVDLARGLTYTETEAVTCSVRGKQIDCLLTLSSYVPSTGRTEALMTVVDITQRKSAEEEGRKLQAELTHLARLGTMGEMATGLAHELNQPLSAISNLAEACKNRLRSAQQNSNAVLGNLEKISEQAVRAGEIIRRMRNFVRKAEPRRSTTQINSVIREVMKLVETEARLNEIEIRKDLDPNLPDVWSDPILIQQVILNLVRNAIESMVEVEFENHELRIWTSITDGSVEVGVADTGVGMSPGVQKHIFEPFFSTKPDGLGMGLSICKTIIETHGSQLQAATNADRGATLRFTLPIAENQAS